MLGADTFLLNSRNRLFVEGRARHPVDSADASGCMIVFLIPFLLAGAFTLWITCDAWYRIAGFALAPRLAEATVIEKGIQPDSEGDDDPYLVYRFSAVGRNGATERYTGQAYVSWSDYEAFGPEDTLDVEYVAYNPGLSRVAGSSGELGMAGFLTVFTLFWNLLTVSAFTFMVRERIKRTRLARSGRLLSGTLMGYETSTDSDNDLWVKLSYAFTSPTGQVIKGVENTMRNELRDQPAPPPGTPVAVLYVDDSTFSVL